MEQYILTHSEYIQLSFSVWRKKSVDENKPKLQAKGKGNALFT